LTQFAFDDLFIRQPVSVMQNKKTGPDWPRFFKIILLAVPMLLVLGFFILVIIHVCLTLVTASDFFVYYQASQALTSGHSPYSSSLLNTAVPIVGNYYLYPPTFAWLLSPLLWFSPTPASFFFLSLQALALAAACWIVARTAGAKPSLKLALGLLAVGVFFFPIFLLFLCGNVDGFIALGMALLFRSVKQKPGGDRSAGPLAVILGLLKITPGLVIIPLLVANPKHLWRAIATGLILVVPFVILNSGSWTDYLRVLSNMGGRDAWHPLSLVPGVIFPYYWPSIAAFGSLLEVGAIAIALGLFIASLVAARRPNGLPTALIAASGAAILPFNEIWLHYLVILLPGLIFTYFQTTRGGRLGLGVGYLFLCGSLLSFPLATIGMVILMVWPVFLLWPKTSDKFNEQRLMTTKIKEVPII
jgi:hypothetical protein